MIYQYQNYIDYLTDELDRRMRNNPRYSQRAYAKQLGLSPGELSEILNQKRKLSPKSAAKIASSLDLNSSETDHLFKLVQKDHIPQPKVKIPHQALNLDLFQIVSDWQCFAILNLSECSGFRWNAHWIAKRLFLAVPIVRKALERLEKVGLIQKKGNTYSVTPDYVISANGVPSEAVRNYHKSLLKKAAEALDTQSLKEREFLSVGLAFDPQYIDKVKEEMNRFSDQIVETYSKGKKTEVYQFCLQFFRLTQREKNNGS